MKRLECKCGGALCKEGSQYVCENCDSIYLICADDKGELFAYQPVEKKQLPTGQIAAKASAISVKEITVRQILLDEDIEDQVLQESMDLDRCSRMTLIESYLSSGDWTKVDEHVNALLLENANCAEAKWYSWMREKQASNDRQMLAKLSGFSQAEAHRLDQLLSYASPVFMQRIVFLFFDGAFSNDTMCCHALSAILPYARNPRICSENLFNQKIGNAFDRVIDAGFELSFNYLLENTLGPQQVDTYIAYVTRFANQCEPKLSQAYYQKVLAVDPGNLEVHRKLIAADFKCNTQCSETIAHVEQLISCTDNTDREITELIDRLCREPQTTANKSDILWELLSYHSTAPEGLKSQLLTYGFLLLESRLWLRARDYFNLVLSFDIRCGDAYWGLCLVQMEARNAQDAVRKTEPMISFSTYDKALAVYTAAGNDRMVTYLKGLSQQQKDNRQVKKTATIGIAIGCAAVLAIVLLILGMFGLAKLSRMRQYSANNIELTLVEQERVQWPVRELKLQIKNGCTVYLDKIKITFRFYDSDGSLLSTTHVDTFCNMSRDEERTWTINLHEDVVEELYAYSFEELRITVAINRLNFFSRNHTEDLGEGKERVLKKAQKPTLADKSVDRKLEKAFEILDRTKESDKDFAERAMDFGYALDQIWENVTQKPALLETMYEKAVQYWENAEYEKAYYVFSLLATVNYKDSEQQSTDCFHYAAVGTGVEYG